MILQIILALCKINGIFKKLFINIQWKNSKNYDFVLFALPVPTPKKQIICFLISSLLWCFQIELGILLAFSPYCV